MRITALALLGAAVAAITAGCGTASPGSSTITGTIDQATFPAAVEQISIISDSSAPATAPVAADGSFTLTLVEGASYRFSLGKDDSIPLVVRTEGDRLQTMVKITGGDANANIGRVRFWSGSASGSPTSVVPAPSTVPVPSGACVDGVVEGTAQPCAAGEASANCEEMGDGKGRHHGRPGGSRHGDDDAPVITVDPVTDASADEAIAVPELNLALGLGCGSCPGM